MEFKLPLNDTWIVQGTTAAAAVRELLDDLSLQGLPTAKTLEQLSSLVAQQGVAAGCKGLHLPGSYPHEQWQGSRVEGFVVSQGQQASDRVWGELQGLGRGMQQQVVGVEGVPVDWSQPYADLLTKEMKEANGRRKTLLVFPTTPVH